MIHRRGNQVRILSNANRGLSVRHTGCHLDSGVVRHSLPAGRDIVRVVVDKNHQLLPDKGLVHPDAEMVCHIHPAGRNIVKAVEDRSRRFLPDRVVHQAEMSSSVGDLADPNSCVDLAEVGIVD